MIEFICEHCQTDLSIAPEQIGNEIFCPACEEQLELPELSPEMEEQLHIALTQAKTGPIKKLDPETVEKLLGEPVSTETQKWKKQLAEAFQSSNSRKFRGVKRLKTLKPLKEKDGNRSDIRKIFDIFSDKNKH